MRLKMLIGMSGKDFTLDVNEETDRFGDKEANRLIKAGYAEKAPPVERKKPETKKEWDDERASLLEENETLKAQAAAAAQREAELSARFEALTGFYSNVASALQTLAPESETTHKLADLEKRG